MITIRENRWEYAWGVYKTRVKAITGESIRGISYKFGGELILLKRGGLSVAKLETLSRGAY